MLDSQGGPLAVDAVAWLLGSQNNAADGSLIAALKATDIHVPFAA